MKRGRRKLIEKDLELAQRVCAEVYQVVGFLAYYFGVFGTKDIERALDNLCAGAYGDYRRFHKDLLPWPRNTIPFTVIKKRIGRAGGKM